MLTSTAQIYDYLIARFFTSYILFGINKLLIIIKKKVKVLISYNNVYAVKILHMDDVNTTVTNVYVLYDYLSSRSVGSKASIVIVDL